MEVSTTTTTIPITTTTIHGNNKEDNNKEDNNKIMGVIHHAPIARSMDMHQTSAFGDRMQLVTNVDKEDMLAKYASNEGNKQML